MSSSTPRHRGWTLTGALEPSATVRPERRARALNGLPRKDVEGQGFWMRQLTDPWNWLTLVLVQLYALALWLVWRQMHPDQVFEQGVIPGIDWETAKKCARLAAPTAAVWSAFFILVDRVRPMRLRWWALAFGWGSCMAIWISLNVNSWAATLLNVSAAPGDPAAQARPAVFVAPFVEEASKGTFVFLLAILMRYRIVSALQAVSLSGLCAIGFAFTENIVYYARGYIYGSVTAGAGDVEEAVQQLVLLRGVITSYGHPLFTMFIGLGMVLGLRTRSKLVRVLAPLTGFVVAAFGHMAFNGMSSVSNMGMVRLLVQFAVVVAFMLFVLLRQELKEYKRVGTRLADYVLMGWLPASDPAVYGRMRSRFRLLLVALFRGPRTWLATLRLMRTLTELAYLRDAMVRGIVDEAGQEREKELLARAKVLRSQGLSDPAGLRLEIPWHRLAVWRRRRPAVAPQAWAAPGSPAPVPVQQQSWPAPPR
ncbi:PrsW family intramembrane metalloprotease [Luteococcus peritonei]|uniref:PrsW family intramembrane metalloprotease n=1 Tax=Luteococcus peritonei TaxID=88874 RepID=A0ABW4RWM3_9ACTN